MSHPSAPPDRSRAPGLPPVLVSAYAASPAYGVWDPALEAELLPALCAIDGVVGLEIPWRGALHPHDTDWFLQHVPAAARLAVTPLPWVMQQCALRPGYGIASPDEEGRQAALADLRRIADDVRRIGDRSAAVVDLVALHTAPRGLGSIDALAASLDELAAADWGGAQPIIEHCDAAVAGQAYEKGFLSLSDEIAAITRSGAPVGMWLNWGRSAVELRDPDAVTAQIADAAATGRLVGLSFSGTAAVDTAYGAAWADLHLPVAETDPAARSLLDVPHIADALTAAGEVPWLGVKVSRRPADRTAADVARTVADNLDAIRRGRVRAAGTGG